jgi:hypothetical protein
MEWYYILLIILGSVFGLIFLCALLGIFVFKLIHKTIIRTLKDIDNL